MTLCPGYIFGDLCGVFQNTMRNVTSKKMMERKETTHFSSALFSWSIMHCDERERKAPGFVGGK